MGNTVVVEDVVCMVVVPLVASAQTVVAQAAYLVAFQAACLVAAVGQDNTLDELGMDFEVVVRTSGKDSPFL